MRVRRSETLAMSPDSRVSTPVMRSPTASIRSRLAVISVRRSVRWWLASTMNQPNTTVMSVKPRAVAAVRMPIGDGPLRGPMLRAIAAASLGSAPAASRSSIAVWTWVDAMGEVYQWVGVSGGAIGGMRHNLHSCMDAPWFAKAVGGHKLAFLYSTFNGTGGAAGPWPRWISPAGSPSVSRA